MNEELDNEEVVVEDVPETSEEETAEEVVVNASQDNEEDIDKLVEERANKLFEEKVEDRLIRDRAKRDRDYQKKLSKYMKLENIMKAGLGVDNLDDAINKSSEFYSEQGINIPEENFYSERDERILAKADAKEIIELGKDEMEAEANRIAGIPESKRTIREKVMFDTICTELVDLKATEELKAKGYDTSILNNKDFQEFREQFTVSTPISKIYDMYNLEQQAHKAKEVEKPASAGSAKDEVGKVKETFSAERINNMTSEEMIKYWNNPEFRKTAGLN